MSIRFVTEYVDRLSGTLDRDNETAGGQTDDKAPDKTPQVESVGNLGTDARELANVVFGRESAHIPEEDIALADMYDMTQACSRLALLYLETREDSYAQAEKSLEVRKARISRKRRNALQVLRWSNQAREMQRTKTVSARSGSLVNRSQSRQQPEDDVALNAEEAAKAARAIVARTAYMMLRDRYGDSIVREDGGIYLQMKDGTYQAYFPDGRRVDNAVPPASPSGESWNSQSSGEKPLADLPEKVQSWVNPMLYRWSFEGLGTPAFAHDVGYWEEFDIERRKQLYEELRRRSASVIPFGGRNGIMIRCGKYVPGTHLGAHELEHVRILYPDGTWEEVN